MKMTSRRTGVGRYLELKGERTRFSDAAEHGVRRPARSRAVADPAAQVGSAPDARCRPGAPCGSPLLCARTPSAVKSRSGRQRVAGRRLSVGLRRRSGPGGASGRVAVDISGHGPGGQPCCMNMGYPAPVPERSDLSARGIGTRESAHKLTRELPAPFREHAEQSRDTDAPASAAPLLPGRCRHGAGTRAMCRPGCAQEDVTVLCAGTRRQRGPGPVSSLSAPRRRRPLRDWLEAHRVA